MSDRIDGTNKKLSAGTDKEHGKTKFETRRTEAAVNVEEENTFVTDPEIYLCVP